MTNAENTEKKDEKRSKLSYVITIIVTIILTYVVTVYVSPKCVPFVKETWQKLNLCGGDKEIIKAEE